MKSRETYSFALFVVAVAADEGPMIRCAASMDDEQQDGLFSDEYQQLVATRSNQ